MKEEEKLNLFATYETYIFEQATAAPAEIPACIVTGFLGSGKTTLLTHLLRNRGGLRVAVLINEAGKVDLDSQFVDQSRVHAALGAATTQSLSGGCICCTAAGDLEASLKALRTASVQQAGGATGGTLDYLIIETSGVSDAEPLAGVLARQGYRLESVVAVVDAEAGKQALQQPVAQAQLRCADVVVINKCDLASLGDTANVEDAVQQLSPGVRMTRARYGQVPLPYLLDVEEDTPDSSTTPGAGGGGGAGGRGGGGGGQQGSTSTGPSRGVIGEVGFLSHEPVVDLTGPRYRVAGRYSKTARKLSDHPTTTTTTTTTTTNPTAAAAAAATATNSASAAGGDDAISHPACTHQHQHDHHHQHQQNTQLEAGQPAGHAQLHSSFHTVSVHEEQPISLADFQLFVTCLTLIPGMYRAKGIIWFRELRSHRYVFHLSGRQRVECLQAEPWTSPPNTQLVLIGDTPHTLEQLRAAFLELLQAGGHGGGNTQGGQAGGIGEVLLGQMKQLHERLDVCEADPSCVSGGQQLLRLQVIGEVLHGVRGSQVSATVYRRVNAALHETGHMLLGVPEVPTISATHGQSTHGLGERLQCCLLLPDAHNPILQLSRAAKLSAATQEGGMQQVVCGDVAHRLLQLLPAPVRQQLMGGSVQLCVGEGAGDVDVGPAADLLLTWVWQAVAPALRKAFPHAGCRCDVIALMHSA